MEQVHTNTVLHQRVHTRAPQHRTIAWNDQQVAQNQGQRQDQKGSLLNSKEEHSKEKDTGTMIKVACAIVVCIASIYGAS